MSKAENMNEEVLNQEEQKLNVEVDIQEVSSCERHVKVSVSRDDVERYFEKEYEDLLENASIPGFRVGKAPRKLVEKRFHKEVQERVKSNLLLDSLTQVNGSDELTPISEPDLDVKAVILPEEGPFVYEYNIEVRPVFDVPNWQGLKLEKPVREFSDADVDLAIERIRNSYATLVDTDEPVTTGSYITTKLTFSHEGEVVSSADSEVICVRPTLSFHDGSINDFDKLMKGAKAGDVVTTKTVLADDTPNVALRGKEVDAKFEITKVQKAVLPEVNEEFIGRIGGFQNMGDFRDAVLDTLKRQLEYEQQQRARRQITEQLTATANWELPPNLLKQQAARELQRSILELRRSGFSDSEIMRQVNFLRQNSQKTTAQALKEHFILEKIAETENIEDEQVDYDVEIALIAAQSGESTRRIRSRLEKEGNMDILRNQIIERKVINKIIEAAEFTEVPYEFGDEAREEALDRAAGTDAQESEIPSVSEEEVKEVARAEAEKNQR